ncbi:hypothetical protein [Sulfitobacter sp.]|uniref:hypothetical protein n=1 Tax=Sulfitobacter sp. TaxID=1903071 RepID=UPI0030010DDF
MVEAGRIHDVLMFTLADPYVTGKFPFDKLGNFYDLKAINEAVADDERGVTVKSIVRMTPEA